jgi:hypothetical protein
MMRRLQMSKITKESHPDAFAIARSWEDEARITGQSHIERPFWYMNTETRQLYYDLFGCIGWPSEVTDKDDGMPGYVAIVGVVKPKTGDRPVQDAVFQLLAEFEHKDVPSLLEAVLQLREEYGFGLHPELLHSFHGDPDRFVTTLALLNEKLMAKGGSKASILVSPPADFYVPKAFDHYVRSFRSAIMPDKVLFYFGRHDILKNRLKEFRQGDPAVYAIGGLIHSLYMSTMWMDQTRENTFLIEGEGES